MRPPTVAESSAMSSAEEVREVLFALRVEHDALQEAHAHAQHLLEALESLLDMELDDDPFNRVFTSLRKVFSFSHAMLLADATDGVADLQCLASEPPALIGSRWPRGALFQKVMNGRVLATFSHAGLDEWAGAAALGLSVDQPALYAPVRVSQQRGLLVLLDASGGPGFHRSHVALARRFAVLASLALATRAASQSAAEGRRLRELTAQLRQSEQAAKRNADLLNAVVSVLPMGLTVQDETGRTVVVNDAAAAALGLPVEALRSKPLFGLMGGSTADARRRQRHFRQHLLHGGLRTRERAVSIDGDERTLLVTGKPVRIFDEMLMVTASLDITERKRFENELSHRAFHDALTGLPNQALMSEVVAGAIRACPKGGMFALAFIDLDNFKQVNDYYSHAAGDSLLVAVARRIRDNLRPSDTLARISGDEFLLMLNPLLRPEDLRPWINRVVEALKQPFNIEGHEVLTSASVGTCVYPQHGDSYESLRRCADSAMYHAKHRRKGSASHYESAVGSALTVRMAMEQRLRVAIRERHFRTAFQAKVNLQTGCTEGFEALVRWVEPDGSVHLPGQFIDLATELGLLDEITRFVLDDVAGSLPALVARFGDAVSVAINVGARQAGDSVFMQSFIGQLVACGQAPRIIIELTEDAVMATQHFQRRVLPALRQLGVRVSIDDFGTGFSSLSTLADITADEVKVDRAFITDIHLRERSQVILKAIESLCVALDISMVAEGVETADEMAYLRAHTAIRCGQGYLFARPQFLEAVLAGGGNEAPLAPAEPAPQVVAGAADATPAARVRRLPMAGR